MKLSEALRIVSAARRTESSQSVFFACGFEPLHLSTFLKAHFARQHQGAALDLSCGLFGDLEGNLARALASNASAAVVLVEWSCLDPRLGLRSTGSWGGRSAPDLVASVGERLTRLVASVRELARRMPVALARPSLPLPWLGHTTSCAHSILELELELLLTKALSALATEPRLRLVHPERLAEESPVAERHDPRAELLSGFPFRLPHASALAETLVRLLFPAAPKKGLITDLDETLWAGLVGEVGAEAVAWTQEGKAQLHGIYQSTLGQLVDAGALLGVASKNDPEPVAQALARPDLRLDRSTLYPVQCGWGKKSDMVSSILAAWNIDAASVVFVDDSPLELAEVAAQHPQLTCLRFQRDDPASVLALCRSLRDLFGKPSVTDEDRTRARSFETLASVTRELTRGSDPGFLASLSGTVSFDPRKDRDTRRALELVNKTNQFNLNGVRFTEGDFQRLLEHDDSFLRCVSYADRFGSLGTVGVVGGFAREDAVEVTFWVLSCRAFSRHIEHHMLSELLTWAGPRSVRLAYRETARNALLWSWLSQLGLSEQGQAWVLPEGAKRELAGHLIHQVTGVDP